MTVAGDPGPRLAIAVLDLHVRTDQFQGDAALGALVAEIEAQGHRVAFVRSVLAEDPQGPASWHARLGAFLREGAFDLGHERRRRPRRVGGERSEVEGARGGDRQFGDGCEIAGHSGTDLALRIANRKQASV
ncbi:MAG: hypothetical protein WCJ30_01685, partial [Deltaproteobacteria bacterium]